jgi:radical SAM protein with 4Fe4S-binding SPASM domain
VEVAVAAAAPSAEQAAIREWVPSAIPELHLEEREGQWLCLNPAVPGWIFTTNLGALLLQLVDGQRSVGDIVQLLADGGVAVSEALVTQFFVEANEGLLFGTGQPLRDPLEFWDDRRLAAMHLHLTDRCNLECTYCLRHSSPRIPIRHRPEQFIGMLEYIKPLTAPRFELTFTGGEPLMYPGFTEVVEASTALGYSNILLSNGIAVTRTRAEFIARHFARAQISLDGADAEEHAANRGNNFDKVVRGIELLVEAGANVIVQVTMSRQNLEAAARVREVLPPTVKARYTPAMPHGRGAEHPELFIDNDQLVGFRRKLDPANAAANDYRPGEVVRSCHAGLSNLSISDKGDVYPCHLMHAEEFHFGNIFHDALEDIFFGPRIHAFVGEMDVTRNNPICSTCSVRYLCGGGCKANTLAATGDWHGVDLWCTYQKKSIFDDLFAGVRGAPSGAEAMVVEGTT